ncbi:MAG: SDR family NAD(P)-dependent oxidoreductase [Gemmataceae bacterium]|nr:SDR family NAD(P)-dependent oxidoreductase [Gemmataceae bacterium]MCI0739374.1 SDR family NAD(P)-dependent oxidoreductase [Gemmataceae bacterium]
MQKLKGHVAVVAGATRGAGRGIARGLGEAGATVYCTGRSTRGKPSPYGRPETIEATAELVSAAGGTGIPVRVDHTVETAVRKLFARVGKEAGRLDFLINSVAGEDPALAWQEPLAKFDMDQGLAMMRQAVFSRLLTIKHAAPLMTRRRKGLIVEVTEGDTLTGSSSGWKIFHKVFAFLLAEELRKHRVAVVTVTPGFLRSETMLEHFGVTEANWREAGKKDPTFLESESPLFIGRAVAALAADPKVLERSGDVTSSWELARQYDVVDADGRRPDWAALWEQIASSFPGFQEGFRREMRWLDRLARRAERYAGGAAPKRAKAKASTSRT